jgi:predicted amidohydrolase YtcJ
VLTGDGRFEAAALLVAGGRIAEVLPRATETAFFDRADVDVVDLARAWVVPGFVDTHLHLRTLALKRARCDLSGARSSEELAAALARHAATGTGEGTVHGVDWDESGWQRAEFPTRVQLDAAVPDRPALARRVCGHVAVANSAFLRLLASSADPPPSRFVDTGRGLLTEDAVWEANRLAAPPSADVAASFAGAVAQLHALGITAIHDIVTPGSFDEYVRGLETAGPLRIDGLVVGDAEVLDDIRRRSEHLGTDRFRAVGVKCFADGSLGGRMAALRSPYADGATRGELLLNEDNLRATYRECAARAVVCAVHAIGDRAVAAAVAARRGIAGEDWQLRIEHAEVLDGDLVEAIAAAGIFLSVQPNFIRNWGGEGGLYAQRLGPQRWAMTNPLRTLESAGVAFAFGSDGMPPGPLFGIGGAVRHPVPSQSLAPTSALARYTGAGGEIPGHECDGGVIERDRRADFAVLSANPLLADPDGVNVRATVVGGEPVFEQPV